MAKAWLALNKTNYSELARKIGVHPSMVEKIFRGVRCTPGRIDQLVEHGVPRELLPNGDEAVDG